jgi:hypothetical protein
MADRGGRCGGLPDELSHDLATNIFTFDVGHSLPVT